tara:strand:- start:1485 stop:2270 length:786 start_codon:yes stop_codon:yes gene_type:complete
MIKVCTVYFEGKYSPDYVNKLYRGLKENSIVDFEFICLSDTKHIKADTILPYNRHDDIKKHWHKLKFFSPQFADQNPGDDIIIMDIDQIITNNVDDILTFPVSGNTIGTYRSWWISKLNSDKSINTSYGNHNIPLNGGFYKFKSGELSYVWDRFIENPNYWQEHYYKSGVVHARYYGEQNFVHYCLEENGGNIKYLPLNWVGKWTNDAAKNHEINMLCIKHLQEDYFCMDDVNPNVKIVHFNGINENIHENKSKIVEKYWK